MRERGGGAPIVSDLDFSGRNELLFVHPSIAWRPGYGSDVHHKEIGLFKSEKTLGQLSLVSHKTDQSAGSPPKCAGESGHEDRRESSNSTVILASREASASDSKFHSSKRFDEQADFFVKGVIGLIVLAVVNALLKRF